MAAMATPKDVAVWMMQQVRPDGARLFQPDAIEHILQMFGPNFLSKKPRGNSGISSTVLREFKKLHGGTVGYHRLHRFWEKLD